MSNYNLTFYNKNFRFVYTPNYEYLLPLISILKNLPICYNSKRFLVGAGMLKYYLGIKNAETVLKSAQNMKTDKSVIKFRKYGKIEIYVK